MTRLRRTLVLVTTLIAVAVTAAHGQGQPPGRGGPQGGPPDGGRGGGRGGGAAAFPQPKPAIANAKPVRLKFGSPEYFAFYAKNAAARPWLALGRQVQFVHAGTLYEVVE